MWQISCIRRQGCKKSMATNRVWSWASEFLAAFAATCYHIKWVAQGSSACRWWLVLTWVTVSKVVLQCHCVGHYSNDMHLPKFCWRVIFNSAWREPCGSPGTSKAIKLLQSKLVWIDCFRDAVWNPRQQWVCIFGATKDSCVSKGRLIIRTFIACSTFNLEF